MVVIKIFFVILAMIVAMLGILPAITYQFIKKRIHSWPVVVAKVTHTRLLDQLGASGETIIEAIIHFEYEFRGKSFTSKTPVLKGHDLFPSLEYEKMLIEKYKVGELYNARVDPISGKFSFLEVAPLSHISAVALPLIGVGIVCFVFGYIYFIVNLNW